jgi:hypothetical protein
LRQSAQLLIWFPYLTSRSLVKYGLDNFFRIKGSATNNTEEAGIANKPITPYEIGLSIAPRINAVGRLEQAIDALRLLCTKNCKKRLPCRKVGGKNKDVNFWSKNHSRGGRIFGKKYPDQKIPSDYSPV